MNKIIAIAPDRIAINGVLVPYPDDELALLDLLRGATDLIVESGGERGYRTTLPGMMKIPGSIQIWPEAELEISGPLTAQSIVGVERAKIFVHGDLTVRSISVNPGPVYNPELLASEICPDEMVVPGIVVAGTLKSKFFVESRGGSIYARDIRAVDGVIAGGSIKIANDIYAGGHIKAGREMLAGGIIYCPGGEISAGKMISAQLLYGKELRPGIPWDLAVSFTDRDRTVFGRVLGGDVIDGYQKPHPHPSLLPNWRLPAPMRDALENHDIILMKNETYAQPEVVM